MSRWEFLLSAWLSKIVSYNFCNSGMDNFSVKDHIQPLDGLTAITYFSVLYFKYYSNAAAGVKFYE